CLERKIVWAEAQIWGTWGEICASGAPNDFSRSSETPIAPTHYSEEPICREPSTNQLLFMQNKPNFRKAQMNANVFITKEYENISDWTLGQNKPNSNPIKPNFRKAKMNVNSLITKDYRKNDAFVVRKNKPNSNPISKKAKMNANVFVTRDYENETALRPQKNKPKQSQFPKGQNEQKKPEKLT
ncbi:MAG: hypothetical protein ABIL62_08760, partial [Planctomycetota bacterium]